MERCIEIIAANVVPQLPRLRDAFDQIASKREPEFGKRHMAGHNVPLVFATLEQHAHVQTRWIEGTLNGVIVELLAAHHRSLQLIQGVKPLDQGRGGRGSGHSFLAFASTLCIQLPRQNRQCFVVGPIRRRRGKRNSCLADNQLEGSRERLALASIDATSIG